MNWDPGRNGSNAVIHKLLPEPVFVPAAFDGNNIGIFNHTLLLISVNYILHSFTRTRNITDNLRCYSCKHWFKTAEEYKNSWTLWVKFSRVHVLCVHSLTQMKWKLGWGGTEFHLWMINAHNCLLVQKFDVIPVQKIWWRHWEI